MKRDIPWPLWIAITALILITMLTTFSLLRKATPGLLATVIGNIVLMIGLMLGHKWAYVVTILFSALGVAVAFSKGASHGLAVMFGNCLVVIPVLISTGYFFPPRNQEEQP